MIVRCHGPHEHAYLACISLAVRLIDDCRQVSNEDLGCGRVRRSGHSVEIDDAMQGLKLPLLCGVVTRSLSFPFGRVARVAVVSGSGVMLVSQ